MRRATGNEKPGSPWTASVIGPVAWDRLAIVLFSTMVILSGCLGGGRPPSPPDRREAVQEPDVSLGLRIEPSDTACTFAGRHGVEPTALLAINGLDLDLEEPLPPAAELVLPEGRPARYQVRRGDTLTSLSRYFGVSVTELARLNALEDANRLGIDDWLQIPAGASTVCPPTPEQAESTRSSAQPETTEALDPEARRAALEHAETAIRAAEARYDAADFPSALELVGVARHVLGPLTPDAGVERLSARASWISGLALVGLERREEALSELRDALRRDPSLADSPSVSPKIAALLEAARKR